MTERGQPAPARVRWEPTVLRAGELPVPAERLAPPGVLPEPQAMVVNALLLRGRAGVVLVDAGSGPSIASWPGGRDRFADALAAAGVSPPDVDLVLLTHLDFDHAGGLLTADGRPAYPNARVVALREGPDAVRGATPASPWDHAPEIVRALEAHGVLDAVDDGHEPAPGIVLRALPGHRPGHAGVEVDGDLVHVGDLFHHPLHVEHPGWHDGFDDDPAAARRTRDAVLARCAASGALCTGGHLPGLRGGRIVAEGPGYSWRPRR